MTVASRNKAVKLATAGQYKTWESLCKAGDAGKTLVIRGNPDLASTLRGWGFYVDAR